MADGTCRLDGCDRPRRTRGMCNAHYARWHAHGDAMDTSPLPPRQHPTCSVDGCTGPVVARGWCLMHYDRATHNNGDPGPAGRIYPGDGWVNHWGYRRISSPRHPLADPATGTVLQHRAVLFDAIGPGSHSCHWCDVVLTWGVDLHVDHLDWDKLNNDPANLVPSCAVCNARRQERYSTG